MRQAHTARELNGGRPDTPRSAPVVGAATAGKKCPSFKKAENRCTSEIVTHYHFQNSILYPRHPDPSPDSEQNLFEMANLSLRQSILTADSRLSQSTTAATQERETK